MEKSFILGLVLLQLTASSSTAAQARAVARNSTKLTELRVSGSQRFPSALIATATGLKLGDDASDAPLKQAADRLAATGMFSDITYSYVSRPLGTSVEFKVTDIDKLYPAFFDNFVWMSSDDLLKELQKREPLFVGKIPNAGEMSERLTGDLKNVLESLHISATVRVFPRMPQYGGELIGFSYAAEGVKIPVVSIEFPGASPEMALVLQKAAADSTLLGDNYSEMKLRSIAGLDFVAQYHTRGYLKVAFGDPVAELRDRAQGSVAVTLPVQQGLPYKLGEVRWSGNKVFSQDELAKAIKDEPGKPLNQVEMEEEIGGIFKIYGTRGNMEAHGDPKYDCDDASQTVAVTIHVTEGDQYHMGNVDFKGLSESAAASLRQLWKLHPGDPYDSSYPGLFLSGVGRQFDLSRVKIQYQQQPRRDTKTVDLIFTFAPKT
ncbi:MAG: POTRA domain-containing protein [Terriglobales bacterium]